MRSYLCDKRWGLASTSMLLRHTCPVTAHVCCNDGAVTLLCLSPLPACPLLGHACRLAPQWFQWMVECFGPGWAAQSHEVQWHQWQQCCAAQAQQHSPQGQPGPAELQDHQQHYQQQVQGAASATAAPAPAPTATAAAGTPVAAAAVAAAAAAASPAPSTVQLVIPAASGGTANKARVAGVGLGASGGCNSLLGLVAVPGFAGQAAVAAPQRHQAPTGAGSSRGAAGGNGPDRLVDDQQVRFEVQLRFCCNVGQC